MSVRTAIFVATVFASTTSAAPFLNTKMDFLKTNFCKVHTCKLVAVVPSGVLDQYNYTVDKNRSVVVWKATSDKDRSMGQDADKYIGMNNGISMIWYGIQDTPVGSEKIFAELVGMATGKAVSPVTALKWLDQGKSINWGDFTIHSYEEGLPSTDAAILNVQIESLFE